LYELEAKNKRVKTQKQALFTEIKDSLKFTSDIKVIWKIEKKPFEMIFLTSYLKKNYCHPTVGKFGVKK
jgi:hypothetical protein